MLTVWLIVVLFFMILYFLDLYRARHPNFPPGPPRLPIWGSYWFLLKEDYEQAYKAFHKLAKKYNTDLVGLYLGNVPCVYATSYKACKELLTRDEFNGRLDGFIIRKRSFGEIWGIFFRDGYFWREQRRFTLRQLRDCGFGRRFAATEDVFQNEVAEICDNCLKNEQILFPNAFYAPILNSILYILVGKKFESQLMEDLTTHIVKFFDSFNATGCAISITPWLRHFASKFFRVKEICEENRHLFDFMAKEVEERKLSLTNNHSDFLDAYLNKIQYNHKNNTSDNSFTESQLIWVLIDYMFPAPIAICFFLNYIWAYFLLYPNIQDNIYKEIEKTVGRNRPPNLNDRSKMPYTEAVIRETLRKHPLLTISTPRRCTEDTKVDGYFIPKNTIILPGQWSANHDPTVWEKPDVFQPERFLDENGSLIKKDYTLAFGGGKRVCPGETFSRQLAFLFVTGLLQKFHFMPVDKVPDINKDKGGFVIYMEEYWIKPVLR